LHYPAPPGTPAGDTYLRFRLGHTAAPSFDGPGGEGEVEDYKFPIKKPITSDGPYDFGDAPAPYPTLLPNGAYHSFKPGFTLGGRWDNEPNGQPHPQALGDDLVSIPDEDGVKFLNPIVAGGIVNIAGSPQSDHLMISFDAKAELVQIDDLDTPGGPDWLLPHSDWVCGMSLDLAGGDDEVTVQQPPDLNLPMGISAMGGAGKD